MYTRGDPNGSEIDCLLKRIDKDLTAIIKNIQNAHTDSYSVSIMLKHTGTSNISLTVPMN
jgi:hypothetical protein